MAQSISSLATNAKIKFGTLYGAPIIWKIADKNHDGYPDNSVTLVSDQIIKLMCFDAREPANSDSDRGSYGNNRYIYSNIRQWLNSAAGAGAWYTAQHSADTAPSEQNVNNGYNAYDNRPGFLNAFTADEMTALLDTAIMVEKSMNDGGSTDICTDKIFLLSCTEVGIAYHTTGSVLSIFSDRSSRIATMTAACVSNSNYTDGIKANAARPYWLRDANFESSYQGLCVSDSAYRDLNWPNAYDGSYGLRPACNLSAELLVSDSTDADGCYTIIYNQAPTAPGTITIPTEVIGGQNLTVSWGESSDADGNLSGYKLEQCVNGGTWTQIYQGSARSYSASITFGWTSVQFRVKAYDTAGAESAYTTSATRTVTNNRTPVITGSDADLGSFSSSAPTYDYTVTDEDGHTVTVVETIDGVHHKSYTCTLGTANTFSMTADEWLKTLNGSHTVVIEATDAMGATATRTMTFTKSVTSVAFVQTDAMAADDMPTKAILNVQGYFPAGCTLIVEICNNGFDASPTWEEVTSKAQTGQMILFSNTAKTASSWGVKVRVTLNRGSATDTCYITSIGGNFA